MKVCDLLRTKQENLSHVVGLYIGQYNKCSDPKMVQISVLWSDGMRTIEFEDNFEVINESR